VSGHVATVFGCTGFLGRYLVHKLGVFRLMLHFDCHICSLRLHSICFMTNSAKAGTQVVVPFREEDEKRHLKVTGDLGQIIPLVRDFPHLSPLFLHRSLMLGLFY